MNTKTKILNKILTNLIQQCHEKHYMPLTCGIYSGNASLVQHSQINKYDEPHLLKDKNHMIISNVGKTFDEIQHHL